MTEINSISSNDGKILFYIISIYLYEAKMVIAGGMFI